MFTDAHIDLLTQRSLLSLVFEKGEIGSVFAHLKVRECEAGETFVNEGEQANDVFIPLSGDVELFITIKGKLIPSGALQAGRTMNTFAVIHHANYQYSARFKTAGLLCQIPAKLVRDKLAANPRLNRYLMGMTEDHDIRAIAKELDQIGCSHKFKVHLLSCLETVSVGPQDWIIKPGETVPRAYYLLEGNVVTHKTNAPQVPSRVWFGWRTLTDNIDPNTFLKAVSNARLFSLSQADYEQIHEAYRRELDLYTQNILLGHNSTTTEDESSDVADLIEPAAPIVAVSPVTAAEAFASPAPDLKVAPVSATKAASPPKGRSKAKASLENNGQLRELFRGARKEVILSSAMAIIGVCLGLLLPFLSQLFFDDVLMRRDLSLLKLGLSVLGLGILASGFLAWLQARYSRYLQSAFERRSHALFTKRILTLAGGMFAERQFGDFKRRVLDLSHVQTSLFQFFSLAVFAGLTLLVHAVILSFYTPLLALVIGSLALTLYAITSSRLAHEHLSRYLWRVGRFILMGAAAVIAVLKGLTPGQVVAAAMIAGQSLTPLRKLTIQCSLQDVLSAWRHLGSNLRSLQEAPASGDFKKDHLRGDIEFKDVWFRHGSGPSEWILQGVSFKIESGQHIALIGETGSGRSTLAALLTRRYTPTRGQILIDGRDYLDYNVDWLRSQMAVLNKEAHVVRGSFAENIVGFGPLFEDNRVRDAALLAGADDFISKFKNGYKATLHPEQLSETEREKVAFARALYRAPQLLILDGISSQFDRHVIDQSLVCTTLNIASSTQALDKADGVLMIQKGKVAGFAPHAVLKADLPSYHALCMTLTSFEEEKISEPVERAALKLAPKYWSVSASVFGLASAMATCVIIALSTTIDVSIRAEGQLEQPGDFKTAVSVRAGQIDGLQVKVGQVMAADEVVAWMKTDGVSEQAIKELIDDLGQKSQKVTDWTLAKSDLSVKASSAGDATLKRQILDAQARMQDFLIRKRGSRNDSLHAIAAAKAGLETYLYTHQVRTPTAGRISGIAVKNGESVAARQEILRLLPEQTVWTARVFVPAKDLARVHVGDSSHVHIDTVSRVYEGRVVKLDPSESKDGATAVIDLNVPAEKREPSSAQVSTDTNIAELLTASGARVQSEMISRKVSLYHFLFDPKQRSVKTK